MFNSYSEDAKKDSGSVVFKLSLEGSKESQREGREGMVGMNWRQRA